MVRDDQRWPSLIISDYLNLIQITSKLLIALEIDYFYALTTNFFP
jgi:hypothetical protein